MKHSDDSMLASEAFGRFNNHDTYVSGNVVTPLGIVTAYTQDGHTRVDFVHKGRLYMRSLKRRYTTTGLATIGHRFAKEISRK